LFPHQVRQHLRFTLRRDSRYAHGPLYPVKSFFYVLDSGRIMFFTGLLATLLDMGPVTISLLRR
jgi:hypothetical protein